MSLAECSRTFSEATEIFLNFPEASHSGKVRDVRLWRMTPACLGSVCFWDFMHLPMEEQPPECSLSMFVPISQSQSSGICVFNPCWKNMASYHLSVSIPICHTLQPPQDVYGSQTTACQTPRDSQNQVGGFLGPAQKTTRKIIWIFSFMICSFWHAKVYNTVEPVNTDMDQIVLQNLQFNIEDAYILETWNTYFMKNVLICGDNVISYISI